MKYFFMLILSISILICCSSCGSAPEPSEKFHNASQSEIDATHNDSDGSDSIDRNHAEDTIEHQVWILMQKESLSISETEYIVQSLPNLNLSEYNKIDGSAIALLTWFNSLNYSMDEKLNVYLHLQGLDGTISETYSYFVGEIFLQDNQAFIEFFGDKDVDDNVQEMIDAVAHYCAYEDINKILKGLSTAVQDEELNTTEMEVKDTLITSLEKKLQE